MNASRSFLLLAMAAVTLFSETAHSATYWGGEIPFVTSTVVEASVTETGGEYTYSYTVKSGAANIGTIIYIDLDISAPLNALPMTDNLVSSSCYNKDIALRHVVPPPKGTPFVPAVAYCAPGWQFADLDSLHGLLNWDAEDMLPGSTTTGIMVKSPGLPGIRTMIFRPETASPVGGEESGITFEQIVALDESVTYRVKTIGPTVPPVDAAGNSIIFLDILRGYIAESQTLGWLTDPALATALSAKLDAASAEIYNINSATDHSIPATALMREFMAMAQNATPSQITLEAKGLLYYNAQYIIGLIPPWIPPPVHSFILTPLSQTGPLGIGRTLTATYAIDGVPQPGKEIYIEVVDGPNTGWLVGDPLQAPLNLNNGDMVFRGFGCLTNAAGQCLFSYLSMTEGKDTVAARLVVYGEGSYTLNSEMVTVIWKGGSDLRVKYFIPPFFKTKGPGNPIKVREITGNDGSTAAAASITRYYLSATEVFDPATITVLGERAVPPLAPYTQTAEFTQSFPMPAGFAPGSYFLFACADADNTVPELNEANNCQVNQFAMAMEMVNRPPVCTAATARLKDPNALDDVREHPAAADVLVENVTDPDGDVPVITVSAVTEIEEVDGPARHGKHDKHDAEVEKWLVAFSADDGKGGSCTGEAVLAVPKIEEQHGERPHKKENRDKHKKR